MKTAAKPRSWFLSACACYLGVASAVLFHYDHRLNQAGIGSPLGFGDAVVGSISAWVQPWLIIASLAGFPFWSIGFLTHVLLGFLSGAILAGIVFIVHKKWEMTFWPIMLVLGLLSISCTIYSVKSHKLYSNIISRHAS